MPNTIRVKRSATASAVPSGLQAGEIAVNTADKRLYVGDGTNTHELTRRAASTSGNRVQLSGVAGELADDAAFTFDPTTDQLDVGFLQVTGDSGQTTVKRTGNAAKILNITQESGGPVKIGDVNGERDGTLLVVSDATTSVQVIGATLTTENIRVGGALYGLQLGDNDGSHYVEFKAPATVASNVTLTLPSTAGSNGQVLTTNGTGTLSWTTPGGGGGGATVPDFLLFNAGII